MLIFVFACPKAADVLSQLARSLHFQPLILAPHVQQQPASGFTAITDKRAKSLQAIGQIL
jgi:hypothetical protein